MGRFPKVRQVGRSARHALRSRNVDSERSLLIADIEISRPLSLVRHGHNREAGNRIPPELSGPLLEVRLNRPPGIGR